MNPHPPRRVKEEGKPVTENERRQEEEEVSLREGGGQTRTPGEGEGAVVSEQGQEEA